ncbi:hypothetical protein GCM10023176_37580 [Micromonospora coerulea]|uniref:Uncharacterized protein n=1 Tax=Micromonospora coerulea TaxID=47856 RepID=A0ABP8SSD0_9ACTN
MGRDRERAGGGSRRIAADRAGNGASGGARDIVGERVSHRARSRREARQHHGPGDQTRNGAAPNVHRDNPLYA